MSSLIYGTTQGVKFVFNDINSSALTDLKNFQIRDFKESLQKLFIGVHKK